MNAGAYNADVENDMVEINMNAAGKVYADDDSVVSYDDRTSSSDRNKCRNTNERWKNIRKRHSSISSVGDRSVSSSSGRSLSEGCKYNNSGEEIASLSRDFDAGAPRVQAVEELGVLPRSRREWCIVIFAVSMVMALALGLGLGLVFGLGGDRGTEIQNQGGGKEVGKPPPRQPSVSDTESTEGPKPSPAEGLASFIQAHVVNQEISELASFEDIADGKGMTAQQRARDFLVHTDSLPLSLEDEENNDPLEIEDESRKNGGTSGKRPFLKGSTPTYRVAQRYSIAVLYYATNGETWVSNKYWMVPGVHECDFVGVTCKTVAIPAVTLDDILKNEEIPHYADETVDSVVSERMVTSIDLPENNMTGHLPREITGLPFLERLGLWSNRISGRIPSEIGRLRTLKQLHLDDNELSGNIPSVLGLLSDMTDLSLARNRKIDGRIPAEIGDMMSLQRLRLSNMSLQGGVPSALGRLSSLVSLYLQNNGLRGELPAEFSDLVNLEELNLSGNRFTGGIPESWRKLRKLRSLEVQSNDLGFVIETGDGWCSLRSGAGPLEALVADCRGDDPKVTCDCCTACGTEKRKRQHVEANEDEEEEHKKLGEIGRG